MMRMVAIATIGLGGPLSAVILAGCDAPPQQQTSSTAAPGVAAAEGSGAPRAGASATPVTQDPLVGRWTASYRAARVEVEVPRGLPAKTWQQDDGKTMIGEGRIELFVEPDRMVHGSSEGSLGKLVLRGMVDDGVLRVGLSPEDPAAEPAFGGVLFATLDGDLFVGELRASNQDGSVVRGSPVRMSRPETVRATPAGATASAVPPAPSAR